MAQSNSLVEHHASFETASRSYEMEFKRLFPNFTGAFHFAMHLVKDTSDPRGHAKTMLSFWYSDTSSKRNLPEYAPHITEEILHEKDIFTPCISMLMRFRDEVDLRKLLLET